MKIDSTDLKILRAIEWGGILAFNSALKKLGLPAEEIRTRLDRLREEKLLRSYAATIFVPPFLGQEWFWGCTLIETRRPAEVAESIRTKIPYVTEILYNAGLPPGLGPNLSILFYARDFEAVQTFLGEAKNIDYVEVYRIDRYEFPLPQPFAPDIMKLLRAIARLPDITVAQLAEQLGQNRSWVEANLERLVWDPNNEAGVILVIPEIDWRVCENFMHAHFLLEPSVNPATVVQEADGLGFTPVIADHLFRKRYLQLEADIWGFADLRAKQAQLESLAGTRLHGLLMAEHNVVVTDWVERLLSENN